MAFSSTPQLGYDLTNPVTAADVASGARAIPGAVGTVVNGSDGKLYVLAKAGGAITASNTACAVNASTFAATGSGGSYTSPATAMVSGDYGWFSKANV